MYRPTVRYEPCFKDYIDNLFHATSLDRNQLFRLALYLLPHTNEGKDVLKNFLKEGHSLPSPSWDFTENSMVVWYGKPLKRSHGVGTSVKQKGVTSDVEENSMEGFKRETTRHERKIYDETKETIDQRNDVLFRFGRNTILLPKRG